MGMMTGISLEYICGTLNMMISTKNADYTYVAYHSEEWAQNSTNKFWAQNMLMITINRWWWWQSQQDMIDDNADRCDDQTLPISSDEYVCIYINIYMYINIYINRYKYIYVYIYIHIYI